MKKILFILLIIPSFLLAQGPPQGPPPPCPWVNNNFPEITHFDGQNSPLVIPVVGAQPWSFQVGSTPSNNTGPTADVSGIGTYVYTEATGQSPNTWYAFQTECFNVDNDPGMELSFFYHMW